MLSVREVRRFCILARPLPASPTGPLSNARHERFAQEYLVDLDAGAAYTRAGYKATGAAAQAAASRLLRDVKGNNGIPERIAALKQERAKKLAVTQEEVVAELVKVAFANMADFIEVTPEGDAYIDLSGLTREQAAALSEVTVEDYVDGRGDNARDVRKVKIKLHSKLSALESLAKHLGVYEADNAQKVPAVVAWHVVHTDTPPNALADE